MIHKIKSLFNEGNGSSLREIARQLGLSRHTVRKYAHLPEAQIQQRQDNPERTRKLNPFRPYLLDQLQRYPKLSAGKLRRKLNQAGESPPASDRTFRRFVRLLRQQLGAQNKRHYEPVIDMVPGVQCQVDLGELRNVAVAGDRITVYFAVFVLSYSRLMYVSVSGRPVDAQRFVAMHDEAFRYFGGLPEECVYDQTKLVVVKEEFREVWFNEMFHHYAAAAGFDSRICEGYDPESKGKVEAGVKYVKRDCFYGEEFSSWSGLTEQVRQWLDNVANVRRHGTTGRPPCDLFQEREQATLKPYLTPRPVLSTEVAGEPRRVDKTSLISFGGNKYSVPMAYQETQVLVRAEGGRLLILDPPSGQLVAEHLLSAQRGLILKNSNHYRDHSRNVTDREQEVATLVGEDLALRLCAALRATAPNIYKDQLTGLLKVLRPYLGRNGWATLLDQLSQRPNLTVSFVRDFLAAAFSPREDASPPRIPARSTGNVQAALAVYRSLADQGGPS
jgi:transposase